MPLSEALAPDMTEMDTNSEMPYDINSVLDPQAQEAADDTLQELPDEYMQPADVPTPSHKGARFIKYNDDGSALFESGGRQVKYFKQDGHIEWDMGGKTYASKGPLLKPVVIDIAKKPDKPKHQLADFTGPDGKPYKALVDTDSGDIIKKYDDPSSRSNAQAEMLRVRILNSAKTQPGIQAYINIKNNYDSLAQNAAIPASQRTAADDAAAMQAFASIEHPGQGATESDKAQAKDMQGPYSKAKLAIKRYLYNQANFFTPEAVTSMRDTAKRALDGRQQTYNEQLAPFIKEAQRLGLTPEEVNGALGGNVISGEASQGQQPPPQPTASPSASPAQSQYPVGTKARKGNVWHTMTEHGWEPPLS